MRGWSGWSGTGPPRSCGRGDRSYDPSIIDEREPTVVVRDDLAEAHRLAWTHIAAAGTWWSGAQRVELAETVVGALQDEDPLPPWVRVSTSGRLHEHATAPAVAHDVAYRLARHAGTMTYDVYRAAVDKIGALPYVELCAIVSTVA